MVESRSQHELVPSVQRGRGAMPHRHHRLAVSSAEAECAGKVDFFGYSTFSWRPICLVVIAMAVEVESAKFTACGASNCAAPAPSRRPVRLAATLQSKNPQATVSTDLPLIFLANNG